MTLPIYYINLASRPDRRAFMDEQLARLDLVAERVEAIIPADIAVEDLARYCDSARPLCLRPNQLACSMSHEKAWRTMIEAGHERAVVLEDDALLSALVPAFLDDLDGVAFDILRFETPSRRVRVLPPIARVGPGVMVRPFRSSLHGRSGYVISANAAKALLGHPALRRSPGDLVVNGVLEEPSLKLDRFITEPGLCVQFGNWGEKRRSQGVGWSDLNATRMVNRFAQKHPMRHFFHRSGRELAIALRSSADHIAHVSKGITKKAIAFQPE